MKNESLSPVNNEPIYKHFTCPDCGGHKLEATLESYAIITGFDDVAAYYIFDAEEKEYHEITCYFCGDGCGWDSDEQADVMERMK